MESFIVSGGKTLRGRVTLSGAKNVALKACIASLLTDDPLTINNLPNILDLKLMMELLSSVGVESAFVGHQAELKFKYNGNTKVPLETGARLRTSSMILGPMLARFGRCAIPNPGGCRIGARPINRHINALKKMGARIEYDSRDGYFHAVCGKLHGTEIEFEKNTHTGTESVILSAVLAEGKTVIRNAAEEIEVDDLINLLNSMGADIKRSDKREITVKGVKSLSGAKYRIMADRNEEVTFAVAAAVTGGKIRVCSSQRGNITAFLDVFRKAGGIVSEIDGDTTEYSAGKKISPVSIVTGPHPGFMTDWQGPWAIFMTQAGGISAIHETVFENRFSYVEELKKMGAKIEYFEPQVSDPTRFYNFNWDDKSPDNHQAIRLEGPVKLHNAVINMNDLRAGATLLLAAMMARGESYVHGVEQIDRGYEQVDDKFRNLGADIKRIYHLKEEK